MKRWRIEIIAARCLAAAALAILPVADGAHGVRAETASPVAGTLSPAALERIAGYIRNEISTGNIAGANILIHQHGKQVYFGSFGMRDAASGLPMTPDSIFQLYSLSKAVTSTAAMMLVEEGRLSLDDPVEKYIPSFMKVKVGVEKKAADGAKTLELADPVRPMTIRDLLRHTSGITYGFYGESMVRKLYANPQLYEGDFDNAEFADRIAKLPLADQSATRWDYGHSTDILGRVVEVVSGQTLYQFEKQRLFDPLGMPDTAYFVADQAQWPLIARPLPRDRFDRPLVSIWDPTIRRRWESGGAGLVSTIGDYARFAQMLLKRGTLDGRRYLKPETLALMASDQIGPETGIEREPFYFPGPTSGFGLGFAVRTSSPPNTTWPLGEFRWAGAAGSFFCIDPVDDMFMVFLVHARSQGSRLQLELKTMVYEAMGKGLRKD
ncbi:MAG: serine hydrolase domain-containing protein [Bradyrhizobium sp.]|uniref:serine hydrolase domain-containing protein n=1 Tax=Bradyrhizobium sp. TaxID=376 RepID=UPI003D1242F6